MDNKEHLSKSHKPKSNIKNKTNGKTHGSKQQNKTKPTHGVTNGNSTSNTKPNVRRLAVQALVEIERNKAYANLVLQQYISQNTLSDVDRRFLTELVYGVVRRKNYLDAIIVALTKRPLKKLSPLGHQILRLGLYQIIYLDKVPESAAVNESVKLAKKMTRGLEGFINGVLRNYLRNSEAYTIDELAQSETERLAFIYNQPTWLLERWLAEYGEEQTLGLAQWFNMSPRLTARVNMLKTSVEAVVDDMKRHNWVVEVSDKLDSAIYIDRHMGPIDESTWFKEGLITFADLASMMVAYVIAP
ncbi:transcription antitermination factor NusB, partial [uncultured Veillonella sp.]|uniref:transcription antitermination factor NusB n=1 Tax=uncultured Veillonella sp. TaxID=159268 RepID=UPI0026267D91